MPRHSGMAFPWTEIISPTAALAGVGITLFATSKREAAQFRRQLQSQIINLRRASCIAFLSASDLMEQTETQLIYTFERGGHRRKLSSREQDLVDRAPRQVSELRIARAALEVDATPELARACRQLYDAHRPFEDLVERAVVGKEYDSSEAERLHGDVAAARDAFLFQLRHKIGASAFDGLSRGRAHDRGSIED